MNKEDYPPSLRHAAYHAFKNGISYKFVARFQRPRFNRARMVQLLSPGRNALGDAP